MKGILTAHICSIKSSLKSNFVTNLFNMMDEPLDNATQFIDNQNTPKIIKIDLNKEFNTLCYSDNYGEPMSDMDGYLKDYHHHKITNVLKCNKKSVKGYGTKNALIALTKCDKSYGELHIYSNGHINGSSRVSSQEGILKFSCKEETPITQIKDLTDSDYNRFFNDKENHYGTAWEFTNVIDEVFDEQFISDYKEHVGIKYYNDHKKNGLEVYVNGEKVEWVDYINATNFIGEMNSNKNFQTISCINNDFYSFHHLHLTNKNNPKDKKVVNVVNMYINTRTGGDKDNENRDMENCGVWMNFGGCYIEQGRNMSKFYKLKNQHRGGDSAVIQYIDATELEDLFDVNVDKGGGVCSFKDNPKLQEYIVTNSPNQCTLYKFLKDTFTKVRGINHKCGKLRKENEKNNKYHNITNVQEYFSIFEKGINLGGELKEVIKTEKDCNKASVKTRQQNDTYFVYIATNGVGDTETEILYKIGMTEKSVSERLKVLSSYESVAQPFKLSYVIKVEAIKGENNLETELHTLFANYRYGKKEFFYLPKDKKWIENEISNFLMKIHKDCNHYILENGDGSIIYDSNKIGCLANVAA